MLLWEGKGYRISLGQIFYSHAKLTSSLNPSNELDLTDIPLLQLLAQINYFVKKNGHKANHTCFLTDENQSYFLTASVKNGNIFLKATLNRREIVLMDKLPEFKLMCKVANDFISRYLSLCPEASHSSIFNQAKEEFSITS